MRLKEKIPSLLLSVFLFLNSAVQSFAQGTAETAEITIVPKISFGDMLNTLISLFFLIAGLIALYYLLMGAFEWIRSGGDKEAVDKARNKIQAAIVGIVVIVVVFALAYTIGQVTGGKICLGVGCEIKFPSLFK